MAISSGSIVGNLRWPYGFFAITPSIIKCAIWIFFGCSSLDKDCESPLMPNLPIAKPAEFGKAFTPAVAPVKKIGVFLWRKGDINTIDRYGPDGLSKLVKIISDKAVNFQSGYLYHYAFVMLIGFSALLTFLILK